MNPIVTTRAAGARPVGPQRPAAITSDLRRLMGRLLGRLRRRWRQAATLRSLAALDDATLLDIGVARAEIASLAAEAHDVAVRTRARTVRCDTAGGRS